MFQTLELNSLRWLSLEDFEGEIWLKTILGEHEYHVSNYGRIKEPGYIQLRQGRKGGKFFIKPFIKVSKDNGKGYHTISAQGHHYYVHRIVADCFVPNMFNLPEIDHINGNRSDNRAENLRWADRSMNMANPLTKIKHRIHSDALYVPIVQIDAVTGEFVKKWDGIAEAARELCIERTNISAMVRGVGCKTLKGYRFIYLSEYDPQNNYAVKYKRGTFTGIPVVSDRWVIVIRQGRIEKVFSNTKTASEHYGCSCSGISKRCRDKKSVRQQKTSIADCDFRYLKDMSQADKDFIESHISNLFIK